MAMGRPQKPYASSWGELVQGLYKQADGRWKVIETGFRFTEPDERRAVAKFRSMEKRDEVTIPTTSTHFDENAFTVRVDRATNTATLPDGTVMNVEPGAISIHTMEPLTPGRLVDSTTQVDSSKFWAWLRETLITQPEYVAKMTGLPELTQLRHLPIPKAAIKIETLIAIYTDKNPSTDKSKREAVATFRKLIDSAGAVTLNDLTQEVLLAFQAKIEGSGTLKSAGTRAAYYGRIKSVISFGLKVGMDQVQIRGCLDRCKVLWTGESAPNVAPAPITREDFHTLLKTAGDGFWRGWLLLGLNLCMTTEDLCELRWADFDLIKGTYVSIRVKTRRAKIPRAATLWPETLTALNSIKRRGESEYVFTSSHGTRFNKNNKVNDFADLRAAAKLPSTLKFNHLRDGAYTTACQATTDERWARVLAGHRAAGLQDNYVLRSPESVRPACDAVYAAYGPFPL